MHPLLFRADPACWLAYRSESRATNCPHGPTRGKINMSSRKTAGELSAHEGLAGPSGNVENKFTIRLFYAAGGLVPQTGVVLLGASLRC